MGTNVKRKRLGNGGQWAVIVDGVEVGRYGGREGHRWAQAADGSMLSEDSPCSATVMFGLVVGAAAEVAS